MIPSLVINLDRAPERWAHMQAVAADIGIEFERLPASDGQDSDFVKSAPPDTTGFFGEPITMTELGCLTSHRRAWRRVLENKSDVMGVFEDDIYMKPIMRLLLNDKTWIPSDAHIIRLNSWRGETVMSRRKWPAPDGYSLRLLKRVAYRTTGYLVTRRGAEFLLESRRDVLLPVDQLMYTDTHTFARAATYQILPAVCTQSAEISNLPAHKIFISAIEEERQRVWLKQKSRGGELAETSGNHLSFFTRIGNRFKQLKKRMDPCTVYKK
jgi:glycosyl transferase family 25